jgi:hypothetical protein
MKQEAGPSATLGSGAAEFLLEFPQQCRSLLELRRELRTPYAPSTADAAEIENDGAPGVDGVSR